jgi:hypothetical protein
MENKAIITNLKEYVLEVSAFMQAMIDHETELLKDDYFSQLSIEELKAKIKDFIKTY